MLVIMSSVNLGGSSGSTFVIGLVWQPFRHKVFILLSFRVVRHFELPFSGSEGSILVPQVTISVILCLIGTPSGASWGVDLVCTDVWWNLGAP